MFLIFLWARLVRAEGFFGTEALVFLFIVAIHIAAVAFCGPRATDFRWRLRLLACAVLMNLTYFLLRTAVPRVHSGLEDGALQAVDRWLIGTNLSLRLESWVHPVLTEVFSFCYLWYLVYLFSSQLEYLFGDLGVLKQFYAGLFSIYAIGYMGYSTVPALGPHLAMADQFRVPLDGWWITHITSQLDLAASNRVDIFPSLHVANSLYILLFDRFHKPWRFWLYAAPCVGLVMSTIYLRYHYFIDIVCGVALSFLALWLSSRARPNKNDS